MILRRRPGGAAEGRQARGAAGRRTIRRGRALSAEDRALVPAGKTDSAQLFSFAQKVPGIHNSDTKSPLTIEKSGVYCLPERVPRLSRSAEAPWRTPQERPGKGGGKPRERRFPTTPNLQEGGHCMKHSLKKLGCASLSVALWGGSTGKQG